MAVAESAQLKTDTERAAERAISRPVILKGRGPESAASSPARELQARLSKEVEGAAESSDVLRSRFVIGLQYIAYAVSLWCVGFVLYSLL
ncbi:MAG: hypothetical protein AAF583_10000 [Pseudomonadota bacterium]